jgi:Holliday junction resolvase RusA-like endonuclease
MISFILPVKPVTKKNSGQIVMRGRFPVLLPSKQYLQFEKEAMPYLMSVRKKAGVINYPVNMRCIFYMEKHIKVDLSNLLNAVDDAMVKAGLILDDNRDIIAGHDGSRVYFDKFNPRIEILITELKDYDQWKNTKDVQQRLI